MTVQQAIVAFVDHHRAKGIQNSSVGNCERALRTFFDPKVYELEVSGLTPRIVSRLLDRMGRRLSRLTGRPLAVTTQRARSERARAFFAFCIARGWMNENPMDGIAEGGR